MSYKHDYLALSHHWAVPGVAMVIVIINSCNGQQNYYDDTDNIDDIKLKISLPV
jgi:hypothetical protein